MTMELTQDQLQAFEALKEALKLATNSDLFGFVLQVYLRDPASINDLCDAVDSLQETLKGSQ